MINKLMNYFIAGAIGMIYSLYMYSWLIKWDAATGYWSSIVIFLVSLGVMTTGGMIVSKVVEMNKE